MKIKMIAIAAAAAVATVFSANLNAQALPPAPKKNIQQEEVKLPPGYIHGLGCEAWSITSLPFNPRVYIENFKAKDRSAVSNSAKKDAASRPSVAVFNVKTFPFDSLEFRQLPDMKSVRNEVGYRAVLTGYIRTPFAGKHDFLIQTNGFNCNPGQGHWGTSFLAVQMTVNKKTIFDASAIAQDGGNGTYSKGNMPCGSSIDLPEAGFYPFTCEIIVADQWRDAISRFKITVREPGKKTYRELKITDFATVE